MIFGANLWKPIHFEISPYVTQRAQGAWLRNRPARAKLERTEYNFQGSFLKWKSIQANYG